MRILNTPSDAGNPESGRYPKPDVTVLNDAFRFVAVDVETANSDSASICQLGLALVADDGGIQTLSFLVDPETHFASFNTKLHGIGAETVSGQPPFPAVIETVRACLKRHPLIQHSAFDKRAINGSCDRYGLPDLDGTWHDSVGIARRAWPELKGNGGHGLGNLKSHLGLDFLHHDAAEDAKAAAQVVLLAEAHTGQNYTDLTGSPKRKPRQPLSVDGDRNGPLFGHVACFSGKLSVPRRDVAALAAGAGISVTSRFSRQITLLVVGDRDLTILTEDRKTTKHRHAEALSAEGHNIRILGETEFFALIGK